MYHGLLKLGFNQEDFMLQDDGEGAYIKEWRSDKPQPSAEAIKTAQDEYDTEYASLEYARQRKAKYPTIEELVVALYDTEDRAEIDKRRADVKKKYPKGVTR